MPFTIVHKEISVKFYKMITKQHSLLLLLSFISPCNSFNVKVMIKDLKLYWFPIKVLYFDIGTFKPNNYETSILYLTNRWYLNHLNYISDIIIIAFCTYAISTYIDTIDMYVLFVLCLDI